MNWTSSENKPLIAYLFMLSAVNDTSTSVGNIIPASRCAIYFTLKLFMTIFFPCNFFQYTFFGLFYRLSCQFLFVPNLYRHAARATHSDHTSYTLSALSWISNQSQSSAVFCWRFFATCNPKSLTWFLNIKSFLNHTHVCISSRFKFATSAFLQYQVLLRFTTVRLY